MPEAVQNQGGPSSSDGASQSSNNNGAPQGNGSQQTQQTNGQQQSQSHQAAPTQTPARPETVPEKYWKDGAVDHVAWSKDYNEVVAFKAAEESKRLSRPQAPDAYKAELPADFKVPDGLAKPTFDANDPLLAQARAVAHAEGLSQEGFSKLLAIYAGSRVGEAQVITNARNAEIAKLGATGTARVDAIGTFLNATLGEAAGKQMVSRILTASDVEHWERLVAKFTSQGGATYRANGREAPEAPGRKSPEEIAKMTPAERLDYSRGFDQSKMPQWRDPRAA